MMTQSDKIKYLNEHLRVIQDVLGADVVVLVVSDKSNGALALRWPLCTPECPHPDACSGLLFGAAGESLVTKSMQLLKDETD